MPEYKGLKRAKRAISKPHNTIPTGLVPSLPQLPSRNARSTHLGAGELAALSGLGALRHLDLNLVRVGQVVRRDAEAAGGNLLDGRPSVIREARRVLAALAGVGPPADLVNLGVSE